MITSIPGGTHQEKQNLPSRGCTSRCPEPLGSNGSVVFMAFSWPHVRPHEIRVLTERTKIGAFADASPAHNSSQEDVCLCLVSETSRQASAYRLCFRAKRRDMQSKEPQSPILPLAFTGREVVTKRGTVGGLACRVPRIGRRDNWWETDG